MNKQKGITLIALVITVIVLLILVGVSIVSLTGENGILKKAQTAGEKTKEGTAKEKVQIAVVGSYGENGKYKFDELKTNLDAVEGIDKNTVPAEITEDSFDLTVRVDGYNVIIKANGEVIIGEGENPIPNPPVSTKPTTVEEAKIAGTVLDENKSMKLKDTYGNIVKVPEGFKIAEDSANEVTGGVVIEDVSHGETVGSQFVWIPLGIIYTNVDNTTNQTITLDRYNFMADGTLSVYSGDNKEENAKNITSLLNYGNSIAKDIENFKTKAVSSGGYYIGRYEARSIKERKDKTDILEQVTTKPNDYIYNYVTQLQAATLAKEMYRENKNFTSDLVNSYAWDTAVVFLQKFDDRTNRIKPYSWQNTLNNSFAPKGTNNIEIAKQDKICNIWDMASNNFEWNTETSHISNDPCVARGGEFSNSNFYTSYRDRGNITYASLDASFRCLLYL